MNSEKEKRIVRTSSKNEALELISKSNGEITIVFESTHIDTTSLYTNGGEDPVALLPQSLLTKRGKRRGRLIHRAAFRRAFDKEYGFLKVVDGRIVSNFEHKSQLAYFLGRVCCNDYSKRIYGNVQWAKGDEVFPEAELNALFGTTNLRELRKKHLINKTIVEGYEMIDNLFVK